MNFLYILIVTTISYILFTLVTLKNKSSSEKSNFGSFISGILTPITIIWLIYGYIIQTEINESTISLINIQKSQLERKTKPIFEYISNKENVINGPSVKTVFTVFKFINHGADIYGFKAYSSQDPSDRYRINVWKKGKIEEFPIKGDLRKEKLPLNFDVSFYDENGFQKNYNLRVSRDQEHINRTDLNKYPTAIYVITAELTEKVASNKNGN